MLPTLISRCRNCRIMLFNNPSMYLVKTRIMEYIVLIGLIGATETLLELHDFVSEKISVKARQSYLLFLAGFKRFNSTNVLHSKTLSIIKIFKLRNFICFLFGSTVASLLLSHFHLQTSLQGRCQQDRHDYVL
jgi:hypothetical protein